MITILVLVTIYLIIGAIIGLKDSELIEESFEEAKEVYKNQGGFKRHEQAMTLIIIILVAPIVEVVAGVRNLIH